MADGDELTHLDDRGAARMVDVSDKATTARRATAQAVVTTTPHVMSLLVSGSLPKGEALPVARVAGILGAKQTPALIPLCHPLPISGASVEFEPGETSLRITASVTTTGVTGVEMEALTAVTIAALTVYDMIKAVDRAAVIGEVCVVEKSGGASGDWTRS